MCLDVGLLRTCQVFFVSCKSMYRRVTTNCCVRACVASAWGGGRERERERERDVMKVGGIYFSLQNYIRNPLNQLKLKWIPVLCGLQ
jgi:hypothetical protein